MPPRINARIKGAAGNAKMRIKYPRTPNKTSKYKSNVLKLTAYTPTKLKITTSEISSGLGTAKIFTKYGISGRFKINRNTFPIYILAITPQKTVGFSVISNGPGCKPKTRNAPSITAVVPEPGIPSDSNGTKAPLVAALFAVSGAVSPLMDLFQTLLDFSRASFLKYRQ